MEDDNAREGEGPVELPVDGVLDLHGFRPCDVKEVVLDYLDLCRARGILEVRVVHGKGMGQLRQTVHALLSRHQHVERFAIATEPFGGAGATIVYLKSGTTNGTPPEAG